MKRLLLAVTFVIGLMFLASQDVSPPEPSPTPITQSLDAPIAETLIDSQTQRELWVFTADWCAACKDYEITLKEAEKQGIIIKRIDYDDNPDLVKKYKIRVVPTTLAMEDDEEMEREEGNITLIAIFELLRNTLRTLLPKLLNIILLAL